jgi:hypothetical protein
MLCLYVVPPHVQVSTTSPKDGWHLGNMVGRTVRVFRQKFTLEGVNGSHAFAPLEVSRCVTNGIPLGCPLFLPVHTVNCVQTLKAQLVQQPHAGCAPT